MSVGYQRWALQPTQDHPLARVGRHPRASTSGTPPQRRRLAGGMGPDETVTWGAAVA